MTLKEKIDYYSLLHKQNLNGRESEDELFELGISIGIEETEKLKDEFAIGFLEWLNKQIHTGYTTKEILEIYKKTL